MVKMAIPLKNKILEKIKEKERLTDKELNKMLVKDEILITDEQFNKILLELEIMGTITVSWVTKDARQIEPVSVKDDDDDEYEKQIQESDEKDYEASFPGTE